ncbi:MAG: hypothetical protein KC589_07425 [Nanoarchaeota archaeon]|nr:hypothetical protein [Nanoarchaeota archaeon]
MKKIKFDKYFYLGIFFSVIQILVLIRNQILDEHILFFYYCDNIALFLAIAFFIRNIPLIKALISTGLILQLVYLIDLISYYLFGVQVTGATTYLANYSIFAMIITLLMHLATAFIALLFVFKEKNKLISLLYAFIYMCFLYFTTIFFTHPDYDINCVFNACGTSALYFEGFTTYWIPLGFLFLIIPTHYLQELIYFIHKKINNKKQ